MTRFFVVVDQLSNEIVPYHETKAAIPESRDSWVDL